MLTTAYLGTDHQCKQHLCSLLLASVLTINATSQHESMCVSISVTEAAPSGSPFSVLPQCMCVRMLCAECLSLQPQRVCVRVCDWSNSLQWPLLCATSVHVFVHVMCGVSVSLQAQNMCTCVSVTGAAPSGGPCFAISGGSFSLQPWWHFLMPLVFPSHAPGFHFSCP